MIGIKIKKEIPERTTEISKGTDGRLGKGTRGTGKDIVDTPCLQLPTKDWESDHDSNTLKIPEL